MDRQLLRDIVKSEQAEYIEARYHARISNQLVVQKGRVDVAHHAVNRGVGIRVFAHGAWGFAATTELTAAGLRKARNDALISAKVLAKRTAKKPGKKPLWQVAPEQLATIDYLDPLYLECLNHSLADKLNHVIGIEGLLLKESTKIVNARVRYSEIFEDKIIVTSDGADAQLSIVQPELSYSAIAEAGGERQSAGTGAGVMGGWQQLLNHASLQHGIRDTAKLAVDLLQAGYADGGTHRVVLSPGVVGLLCHEAIGHTVEADFVRSGSVAAGKLNKRVGSDLVTMIDTGFETASKLAVGSIPFDDEGVKTKPVTIIKNGILTSYLHNRETASIFGVEPTGSGRAWMYDDEPLIRMRNTYFAAGTTSVEELIADMKDGYLVEGSGSGQADSNGEFMFGASHLYQVKNGKRGPLLREATLSGVAFDVLASVDGVSSNFMWDMGTGYCGKGQPAKVDAGGPHVRCKINIGGR